MTTQTCKCCGQPIEVIGPMLNGREGIEDSGHCINPICPLELVTRCLSKLLLITEAEMLGYAKAKIMRLHDDLEYARSRLPAPRMLG